MAGAGAYPERTAEIVTDFEERVRAGLEAGEVGVWNWDVQTQNLFWTPNLEEIHGLPPGSFDGSFSFFQEDIHPDDRARVMETIQRAMQRGGAYYVQYRLPAAPGDEERWLEARGQAVIEGGRVVRMTGICQDITGRKAAEAEVKRRARQQEVVARLGQLALLDSDGSYQPLLDTVVAETAAALDVEMCKLLELLPNGDELLLRAGVGWAPGHVGETKLSAEGNSQSGFTLRTNGPVIVEDLATETRFDPPELLHGHGVVSGITVLIAGSDGRAFGVLGAHTRRRRVFRQTDIDFLQAVANIVAAAIRRKRDAERQDLLIRELRHRVGNLLSLIISLFNNSATGSASIPELEEKFLARVVSLSRAHSLISEGGWKTASLTALARAVLEPYLDRTVISGEDVEVTADGALALSLALHELATNAVKYGALSTPRGRLDLRWSTSPGRAQPALRINWAESGGPAVAPPATRGFGTKLVTAVLERQLNGKVSAEFAETGLRVRIELPLS